MVRCEYSTTTTGTAKHANHSGLPARVSAKRPYRQAGFLQTGRHQAETPSRLTDSKQSGLVLREWAEFTIIRFDWFFFVAGAGKLQWRPAWRLAVSRWRNVNEWKEIAEFTLSDWMTSNWQQLLKPATSSALASSPSSSSSSSSLAGSAVVRLFH